MRTAALIAAAWSAASVTLAAAWSILRSAERAHNRALMAHAAAHCPDDGDGFAPGTEAAIEQSLALVRAHGLSEQDEADLAELDSMETFGDFLWLTGGDA